MDMESTRRLFERSRELGMKKPRLTQPEDSMSYRERETESVETGRGLFSQQQEIRELVDQYRTALAELTSNSKPIITNLTIIAGENLHAAKAVAATVCTNILEVPSDQKLPSLYLLDSIVKNIGRDYIKYFGARLPEVFCRAYRLVDPSTHPQMRHLFGTWKGVFPPQPLQMIEKELAFSNAANGSSSGSATSRSESQSQRPAQSIHVNPKYLEARQRLQQPNRDAERLELDRAVGMNSGGQWPEPTLKTQITKRQRDAPDEFVREKNIVAAYGSYDNDSDHSSQSGLEMGRVKKSVFHKPLYVSNNTLEEKMSIHGNGLDVKRGFPSYAPPTAEKDTVHLLPRKSIFGKNGSGIDESWKSSDEEEYMWDDLNSKSSDQHSVSISQRHRYTPDEPNRSGLENSLWRPQILHEIGTKIDREASTDALPTERKDQAYFRNRRSPSWTEEQHLTADTIYSGSGRGRLGNSEVFTKPLSGVSIPANSLTRTPIPSHMSPSHVGTSNFGNLTNPELVPSVPVGQKRPFVPDYLAEQDYRQSQLPRRPAIEKPQYSQTQNLRSQLSHDTLHLHPQGTLTANSPKFPPPILSTSEPMVHSLIPRNHFTGAEPSSQYHPALLPKTKASANIPSTRKSLSNQSSKDSGAGSKVKKEKLAKQSGTKTMPSITAHNAPLPSVSVQKITRTDPRLTAGSSSSQPSSQAPKVKLSAPKAVSQIKAEQPPMPSGAPSTSQASDSASDPVSSLLSTLMAKGLITASKSESPTSSTLNKSSVPVSSIPVASNKKISPNKNEAPKSAPKCYVEEVKPLIGLEFKPDLIRQSHPSVINELLDNLPHQCDLCGLRLKLRERFERHLEWHALRKPEVNCQEKSSRRWYASQDNWVAGEDVMWFEEETSVEPEEREAMVPADESQCVCVLCGEIFEDFYDHKTNEWMFKGALYMSVPLEDSKTGTSSRIVSKGPIVHSNCISENSFRDLGFPAA